MSFASTKINRLSDKTKRASSAAGVASPTSQKSLIPKLRSVSINNLEQSMHEERYEESLPSVSNISEIEEITIDLDFLDPTDANSIKSDDFKDCLDVKLESNSTENIPSSVDQTENLEKVKTATNVKNATKEKIEKIKTAQEVKKIIDQKSVKNKKPAVCQKTNPSGIPICLSSRKPSPSPKTPSPRFPATSQKKVLTSSSEVKSLPVPVKKSLDHALFMSKKKRLESLQKDLIEKQKPVIDLYNILKDLQLKIEKTGRKVELEPIKILDFEEKNEVHDSKLTGGGGEASSKCEIDPEVITTMKNQLSDLPKRLSDICKNLLHKQNSLLNILKKHADNDDIDKNELKTEVEKLKTDSLDLKEVFCQSFEEQEKLCEDLVEQLKYFFENSGSGEKAEMGSKLNELKQTIKNQDCALSNSTKEVLNLKRELACRKDNSHFEYECQKSKEKIMQLEKQLEAERKKNQHENDRHKLTETSLRTLKLKSKEFETSKQQNETKINILLQDQKASQAKIKQLEKSYEKEIADLNRARNLDKAIIEKMNREKLTFETRLNTATETIEFLKQEFDDRENSLKEKLAAAQDEANINAGQIEELKKEIEDMQNQISTLSMQNEQATDIIVSTNDNNPNLDNETICEQKVVILSQAALIKSLQEKITESTNERLKVLKLVEKPNEVDTENANNIKAFLNLNEERAKYEKIIKQKDAIIQHQKQDLEKMQMAYYYSKAIREKLFPPADGTGQVEDMLKNGRDKLERALAKSSEDERILARYQDEILQQKETIENLQKMLQMRNETLSILNQLTIKQENDIINLKNYSSQIRSEAIEDKKKIELQGEMIIEMEEYRQLKTIELHKLSKELRKSKETLSESSKKCFDLQARLEVFTKKLNDAMEENLQIKTQQKPSRYDFGMLSDNTQQPQVDFLPWNENSEMIFSRYRKEYQDKKDNRKRRLVKSSSKHVRFAGDLQPEDFYLETMPTKLNYNQNMKLQTDSYIEGGDCNIWEVKSVESEIILPQDDIYLPNTPCNPHSVNTKKIYAHCFAIKKNLNQSIKFVNDYKLN